MKPLQYGKMNITSYCPHGFGTRTPAGKRVICGYCSPEEYEAAIKKRGRGPKVSYKKVVTV